MPERQACPTNRPMTKAPEQTKDLIETALDLAVQKITGNSDAVARPTQLRLAHHIAETMNNRDHAIGEAGTGTGKAMALDTPIPTTDGIVPLKDITLSHKVFTPSGKPTNLTQIHDTITGSACYELAIDNGEKFVVDGNHLWPLVGGVSLDPGARVALCTAVHSRTPAGTTATIAGLYELTQGQVPLKDWQAIMDTGMDVSIDVRSAMQKATAFYGEKAPEEEQKPLVISTEALYESGGYGSYYLPAVQPLDFPEAKLQVPAAYEMGRACAKTKQLVGRIITCGPITTRADFCRGVLATLGQVDTKIRGFNVTVDTQETGFTETVRQMFASLGTQTLVTTNSRTKMQTLHVAAKTPKWFRDNRRVELKRVINASDSKTLFRQARILSIKPVPSVPVKCLSIEDEEHLFLVGQSMIPTHNSLAYLVPAGVRAAKQNERSVISTESLSLQAQIINKDAPAVADAVNDLTDYRPRFALLKGWSNYVCEEAARQTAAKITGLASSTDPRKLIKGLDGINEDDAIAAKWALEQCQDPESSGDKDSYDGPKRGWGSVSVTPAECPGDKCPFWEDCKPKLAKEAASDADVIVTNHSMLAVQAAKKVPVIIGNKKLGRIDHVVADECHGLPGIVRSQGAGEISGRRIRSLVSGMKNTMPKGHKATIKKTREGDDIADVVTTILSKQLSSKDMVKVEEGDPTAEFRQMLVSWLASVQDMLAAQTRLQDDLKTRKLSSRFSSFRDELREAGSSQKGIARWVEKDRSGEAALFFSPVYVGGKLSGLWSTPEPEDEDTEEMDEGRDEPATQNRSITAVSATVPTGFGREAGIDANTREYPSPFTAAYADSAMYIPRAINPTDVQELRSRWDKNGKPAFDVGSHRDWATKRIIRLVQASGGRALILSAKANDGKHYAQMLKKAVPEVSVLSQWDDKSLPDLVKEWKEDETSVLVGTKSLATGTDAPGRTNSLVVIDRVPRSPSNPVDDARRDLLIEQASINKWVADRLVYAADAALLIEQSAGRLIRTATDKGMVAILDPRLLGKQYSAFTYPAETARMYVEAAGPFAMRTTDIEHAIRYLKETTQR